MGKGKRLREQKKVSTQKENQMKLLLEQGRQQGVMETIDFLELKIESLTEVEGVGPVLQQRIKNHFLTIPK